jgi:hypothetical protein
MALARLPFRDPRTVARDIPGILDILFPRLSGGLVASLNKKMFSFGGISPISDQAIDEIKIQKAMIFEVSMARAESILAGDRDASWEKCLEVASNRQKRHYDARIPDRLEKHELDVANHAATNLITMLTSMKRQHPGVVLEHKPTIPGIGWIASGNGDFALGQMLIEVKHTDRNFSSGDLRQVLMYSLLKYAKHIESKSDIWTDILLLNPRRNAGLLLGFEHLLRSASANANRVELLEMLRSIVGKESERR